MSIATVVANALEQSGMSQVELASSIGVTQSYISQICAGKKVPALKTLSRISDRLGIPMERFVGETGVLKDGAQALILSEDEIRMLMRYRKLSKTDQGLVRAMVERVADGTMQNKYGRAKSRVRV